jgi:hypothetical protein
MALLHKNTTKYFQVQPYGNSSSIQPDGVVDFYFPSSGFLDLKSLSMFYDVTLSSVSGASSHAFARDGESIIQTLELFVNGSMVNCIQNYQQIYRILSDYGYFPVENTLTRYQMKNGLLNGVVALAPATSINGTYYARNWLGLFNEDAVIDLSKNNIHMRITVSPRTIIASASTTDTFSLSNMYLTCKYYENYEGDMLKSQISFADFKSIQQYNPTTTQDTTLKIYTHNIDYVIGTILRLTNKSVGNVLSSNINNTRFFERNGTSNNYSSWNFKVNQRPIYNYQPKAIECVESMFSLFPQGFMDNVLTQLTSTNVVVDTFAVGGKVGFTNAEPDEVELSFTTLQGSTSIPNYSLFIAKIDNTIALNV